MIFALLSFILALIITLGRQSAAFGKIKQSLWFFSNFDFKRNVFSITSVFLGLLALSITPDSSAIKWIFGTSLLLIIITYLFDFKYIFPEIKSVEKQLGKTLNIENQDKIIGVSLNSIAIAYPLDVVVSRHIVNDKIDSNSIVLSYCAICRSGLVFKSQLNGENLYFKVAGVWRRNMVMVDDKTKSLWQQSTGECIYGPSKGKQLELLFGDNTNWGTWSKKHPNSMYASKCTEARRGFLSREGMMKGLEFATTRMTPPGFTNLSGLPNRETVFGIHYNGISKAYPESELKEITAFVDDFGSIYIELNYDSVGNNLYALEPKSKEKIIVQKHWWLGWKEFHPETEIWKNEHETP